MSRKVYVANYIPEQGSDEFPMPSKFAPSRLSARPGKDFEMSVSADGSTISRYSDDVWDLRVYRSAGNVGQARLRFDLMPASWRKEAKWMIFVLAYIAEPKTGGGLSVASIMNYSKAVKALFKYSEEHELSVSEILSEEENLRRFIRSIKTRNIANALSGVLEHLLSVSSDISGYKIVRHVKKTMLPEKLRSLGSDNQVPVIPPRIFSAVITQLSEFVEEIESKASSLVRFVQNILDESGFACSVSQQRVLGFKSSNMHPKFNEASQMYGLDRLFHEYSVNNLKSLSSFLTKIQHACRLVLHIYSGMRHAEALSLMVGCLRKTGRGRLQVIKLYGETSKFSGQRKRVSWVSSAEIFPAYKVAEGIASVIGNKVGLAEGKIPLFISPAYLEFASAFKYEAGIVKVNSASGKDQEAYSYLKNSEFLIENDDITSLEKCDPFRAWDCEPAFRKGEVWRFTVHQFRRSLAFYVAQSANVSLSALKRQLKHVTREMSVYYCNGSGLDDEVVVDGDIRALIEAEKAGADVTAYLYDAALSEDKLYGCQGKSIEKAKPNCDDKQVFIRENRAALISDFKKGNMAYVQTPLGACTTVSPCDKKLFRSLVSCLNCEKAIIKLPRLDMVISRQEKFISEIEQEYGEGVMLRSERDELEALVSFRDSVSRKSKNE